MGKKSSLHALLNFDLDPYLNPWIPHNRFHALPKPISHFLGYRSKPHIEPPTTVQWVLTFIATLAGLCLVGGSFAFAPGLSKWNPPVMVASLGASAVLDYNAVRSPLAQPRNAVVGHTLSAIVGVGISKLFQLNHGLFENYEWVSGATGAACASLVMSVTNTVHPPGGATAILASTSPEIIAMGWMFVPFLLLGSVLMTMVALIFNNLLRQYPVYWWTPEDVGRKLRQPKRDQEKDEEDPERLGKQVSDTDSERTLRREQSDSGLEFVDGLEVIRILPYRVQLPPHVDVTEDELAVLEKLQERIRTHDEVGG